MLPIDYGKQETTVFNAPSRTILVTVTGFHSHSCSIRGLKPALREALVHTQTQLPRTGHVTCQ